MMPGAEYLEVSGNVYIDVLHLGGGFLEESHTHAGPHTAWESEFWGRMGPGYKDFEKLPEAHRHEFLVQI